MPKYRVTQSDIDNMSHKQKLRHRASYQEKLSTSRPARSPRNPVTYQGTGNLPRLIVSTFPNEHPTTYKLIKAKLESYMDSTGENPNAELIRRVAYSNNLVRV